MSPSLVELEARIVRLKAELVQARRVAGALELAEDLGFLTAYLAYCEEYELEPSDELAHPYRVHILYRGTYIRGASAANWVGAVGLDIGDGLMAIFAREGD